MTPTFLAPTFRTKIKTGMILVSLLVIFTTILSACGGGGSQGQSNVHSILTIQPGPNGNYSKVFNPYTPSNSAPGTQGMVYETLLYFNQLNGQVTPWLASSYQIASDAKSVTFNIRPGVKWSDGKPFTAQDVVFTLNLLKQYPAIDLNSDWSHISGVSAPNDSTVVVTLKSAYSPILWYLAGQTYIVPQHIWSSVTDPAKYANADPVGTGPYKLNTFSPEKVDYIKNTNYWQPGKPQVNEIVYPAYNSNNSVELDLDQGNLTWTGLFTPNIGQTFEAKDKAHNHYWFSPANVVMLYLNITKAPFNNVTVRQAIATALDRNQMYQTAESGYEKPASPTGLVLPNQQQYVSTNYQNTTFTLDAAKAQQLLQSAGFKKGSDGILVDSTGKKLSFKIDVVTGWTDWVTDTQIIANDLKAIGVDASVNTLAYNDYYNSIQAGNYDMAVSWTTTGPTPYYLYYNLLSSSQTAPIGQSAPTNWERWKDATTDNLLMQYSSTADANVQKQAIYGLEKIMVEQVPSIPLVYGAYWYEYNDSQFTGWPTQNNQYAVPSPYQAPDNEVVVLNLKPV